MRAARAGYEPLPCGDGLLPFAYTAPAQGRSSYPAGTGCYPPGMGSYPEGKRRYPLVAARPRRVWAATRRVGAATLSWRRVRVGGGLLPTLRGCHLFPDRPQAGNGASRPGPPPRSSLLGGPDAGAVPGADCGAGRGGRGGGPGRPGGQGSRAPGRRGDPAAGPSYPSEPDQDVAGAGLPCGDESRAREILGSVLRLRGRVPGGRRQAEVRRPDGQVPSGLVSAGPSLCERLPEPATVGGAATILILSFAGRRPSRPSRARDRERQGRGPSS